MASSVSSLASTSMIMLIVLVFLSSMAKSDFSMPPTLSPFFDNLCDEVNCGKGNCTIDPAKPYSFVCKCDPGWRRTRSSDDDDNELHEFLPCVIPNCTLDYSCMPAPPPSPPVPNNISLFDPCYWAYCGEGTCNQNNTYGYTCDCNPGYSNLMNVSHFPCFSRCAIGSDCSRLGVRLLDATTPNGSPGDNSQGETTGSGTSQGLAGSLTLRRSCHVNCIRFQFGGFHWIGIIVVSIAMALWK